MINTKQLKALLGLQKLQKGELTMECLTSGYIYVATGHYAVRIRTAMDIPLDAGIPLDRLDPRVDLISMTLKTQQSESEQPQLLIADTYFVQVKPLRYTKDALERIFRIKERDEPADYDADILYAISKIAKAYTNSHYFHIQQNGAEPGVIDITDDVQVIIAPVRIPKVDK